MDVIVVKYVQILCISVFFSNSANCDPAIIQKDHENKNILPVAGCMAECLERDITMVWNI